MGPASVSVVFWNSSPKPSLPAESSPGLEVSRWDLRSQLCHYWLCDLEQVTRPLWACFPPGMLSKEPSSDTAEWVFVSPPARNTGFCVPRVSPGPGHSKEPESPCSIRPQLPGRDQEKGRQGRRWPRPSPCAGLRQVLYKEKDSDAQPRVWLVEGNASLSAQLTGLGKYVLYEVQVLAFTRIGDGSPSRPPVLERTLDDGESRPCLPHSGVTLRSCGRPVPEGHQPHCEEVLITDCASLRKKGPRGCLLSLWDKRPE